jgi:hypothetical protein
MNRLPDEGEVSAKRAELCCKHGMSKGRIFACKAAYSGMTVPEWVTHLSAHFGLPVRTA